MVVQPTLQDVADRANVHVGTVSRALNPRARHRVNAATVAKITAIADELGYRPNTIARGLRMARSDTIGVLIPDLTNPLFPPMARGIEEELFSAGYAAVLGNTDNDLTREQILVEHLQARQVDGFIIGTAFRSHPLLQRMKRQRVPMVLLNRRVDRESISAVITEDRQGVEDGVRHLVELGHRRIAHLAGPQNTSTGVTRSEGFRAAMAAAGQKYDDELIICCASNTEADGARGMRELMRRDRPFTAVVAGNDLIALGCYDVLGEEGLSCPDDVSVIGFNDMPFADKFKPALTTVRVPMSDMGREAARLLLRQLASEGNVRPRTVRLPVELVVRGSTASPPSARRPARRKPR